MSITPFFSGEVQLAGWNESHNSGSKISFWLPDSKDLDPFRSATIRKNNKAGQRFACVLVEIGDDEQIIQPIAQIRPAEDKPKGGELAKWAGILSADTYWWGWLEGHLHAPGAINSEQRAAYLLRQHLHIDSRAELDHNPEAAKIFREMMREFSEWKNGGKAA